MLYNTKIRCTFANEFRTRGVAQLVSAPRSGRGGRKFESSHPDQKRGKSYGFPLFCVCGGWWISSGESPTRGVVGRIGQHAVTLPGSAVGADYSVPCSMRVQMRSMRASLLSVSGFQSALRLTPKIFPKACHTPARKEPRKALMMP